MQSNTAEMMEEQPQKPIQFIDLQAQRAHIGEAMDKAILSAVHSGKYIMGPEVARLESDLSAFCGATHSISCSNGTDALKMGLLAKNLGPDDAVICPSFTFAATAEVVALVGATPVFVDVNEQTFNMEGSAVVKGIETANELGLRPAGVVAVDLFGQPADYNSIEAVCEDYDMWLMSDAAQSFGASYKGRKVGKIGFATTTSFFPAKPLGCYGDGGAIFTDEEGVAEILKSLRVHGKGTHKYDNARIGLNARMDTVQAAVLIEKLKVFAAEIEARQDVADTYSAALSDVVVTPQLMDGCTSTWAQYTLRLTHHDRDETAAKLKELGVPTAIYYPKPLHQQTAYKQYPSAGELPVSAKLSEQVLSLPMHGYMDDNTLDYIITQARKVLTDK